MTHAPTPNAYLDNLVRTASPARLRWLLLQRSVSLCDQILSDRQQPVAGQPSLRLREVLGELLGGIPRLPESSPEQETVQRQVSDLYVFLLQHLTQAETQNDPSLIREVRSVLDIQCQTWAMVVTQESDSSVDTSAVSQTAATTGLDLNA
ncbi:MAG: flagellar protein FliS [Planctomycetota bacterium]